MRRQTKVILIVLAAVLGGGMLLVGGCMVAGVVLLVRFKAMETDELAEARRQHAAAVFEEFGHDLEGAAAAASPFAVYCDVLRHQLDLFRVHVGRYPTADEGLGALVARPADVPEDLWGGPYLAGPEALVDPWGTPLRYAPPEAPGGTPRAWSCGPNRMDEGGRGDDVGAAPMGGRGPVFTVPGPSDWNEPEIPESEEP